MSSKVPAKNGSKTNQFEKEEVRGEREQEVFLSSSMREGGECVGRGRGGAHGLSAPLPRRSVQEALAPWGGGGLVPVWQAQPYWMTTPATLAHQKNQL